MLERGEEVSEAVTWEDQSMINTFSKLVSRLSEAEDLLKAQAQEREYLDDVSTELELADDGQKVIYRIGDCYAHLPLTVAQARLARQRTVVEGECGKLESSISDIKEQMDGLKIKLKVGLLTGIMQRPLTRVLPTAQIRRQHQPRELVSRTPRLRAMYIATRRINGVRI